MEIYVVKRGDNVDSIAEEFGIPVETLIMDNQITYPYRLAVGQAILITDNPNTEEKPFLYVNGYAYPLLIRIHWIRLFHFLQIFLSFPMVLRRKEI